MKTQNYSIFYIIALMVFLLSCTKEPATETSVKLNAITNEIEIFEKATFVFDGKAEHYSFFSGKSGAEFDSLPKSSGVLEYMPGDTFEIIYTIAGQYKAVVVATSYGNWGEDMHQSIDSVTINVQDFETGIIRAFMYKPKYKLATIEGNNIIFNIGETIDRSKVTMQINTKSIYAVVYPNGDRSNPVYEGKEFTADFSGSDPHIIVESYSKSTEKYNLVFN